MIRRSYKSGFTHLRQKILQGELVYVAHPFEDYCGWYQKLRKSEKVVGYFQIQGDAIGKFFKASTIEDSQYWNAQARMTVTGGENVCAFISSKFSNRSLVVDIENEQILLEIKCHEESIKNLNGRLLNNKMDALMF